MDAQHACVVTPSGQEKDQVIEWRWSGSRERRREAGDKRKRNEGKRKG